MKLYGDIGKVAKKLLNDDYIFANKLKVVSKTDDGTTYTVTGVQDTKSKSIDADISVKANIKGVGVTGKAFTGGKQATVELKYETQDSAGRKATLIGEAGKGVANGTFEFQGGPVGIKVETDAKSSDLYGSIAVALTSEKRSGFAVIGAEGQYNMTNKELMKKNFVMSYCDGKQSEVSLHVLDKMSAGMLSYSHHVRPGFSVGGQMTHTLGSSDTVLAFGSAYRLDGVTTVKAKVNSTGNLALSYIQDVRPNTTLIMSSKFDVNKLDSAKVGISLTVE